MYHLGPQSRSVNSRCGRLFLPFLLPVFLLHHHHLSVELNWIGHISGSQRNFLYSSILHLWILRNEVGLLWWWLIINGPSTINLDWKPQSSTFFSPLNSCQTLVKSCNFYFNFRFPTQIVELQFGAVDCKTVIRFCQSRQFSQFSFPHSTLVKPCKLVAVDPRKCQSATAGLARKSAIICLIISYKFL